MWPDSRDVAEQEDEKFEEVTTTGEYLTVLFTLVLLVLLFLVTGCVSAPVAPNLKFPEQKACRTVALPPVPDQVRLIIDGDKVDADQGGEQLLRGYVASRYVFKSAGAK